MHHSLPSSTLAPEHAAALEQLLRTMLEHHRVMLAVCIEHREALSQADTVRINALVLRQAQSAQSLAELDERRTRLIGQITRTPPRQPAPLVKLAELAQRCAEPMRARLLSLADELREVVLACQQQQQTIRLASEALLAHCKSLMSQVTRQLSGTGTYSRFSQLEPKPQVVSGLDVTS